IPQELSDTDKQRIIDGLIEETIESIDKAIDYEPDDVARGAEDKTSSTPGASGGELATEMAPEKEEERPEATRVAENLLDRLLYKGVLPRYAFPTDVATFYVFDRELSTAFRPAFRFTPSQGLSVALSQYAPGKEVWIGGKLWTSGAIYSPVKSDRFRAWNNKRLYYECSLCHYAKTFALDEADRGERRDCPACGQAGTLGMGTYWLRPPGFAHPVTKEEGTSPDDQPARSYATRAKLVAPTPSEEDRWQRLNPRLRVYHTRDLLLVTNRGPKQEGYTYCTKCGLIEPTALGRGTVTTAHKKPYPDLREPDCAGGGATKGLVLGTDFITDVLLISLSIMPPITLRPGLLATDVALRTLCEALTAAGCTRLELEETELQAEHRPALTQAGWHGNEVEIYVYDTLAGGA
ncbi:MAG: hypothetical protein MN733_14080, partial [Nitrososphaera sp.]|nr:hypothetical protein [Nitrososphaera sp.]